MKLKLITLIGVFLLVLATVSAIDDDGDGYYDSGDFEEVLLDSPDVPGKVSSGSECDPRISGTIVSLPHNLGETPNTVLAWEVSWQHSCFGVSGWPYACPEANVNNVRYDNTNVIMDYSNNGDCRYSDINWKAGIFEPDCDDSRVDIYPGAIETCGGELLSCENWDYIFPESVYSSPKLGEDYIGQYSLTDSDICPSDSVFTGFKYDSRIDYNGGYFILTRFQNFYPQCTKISLNTNKDIIFGESYYPTTPRGNINDAFCEPGQVVVGFKTSSHGLTADSLKLVAPICQQIQYNDLENNFYLTGEPNVVELKYKPYFNQPNWENEEDVLETFCDENSIVTSAKIIHWGDASGDIYLQSFDFKCSEMNFHPAEKTYDEVCSNCECSLGPCCLDGCHFEPVDTSCGPNNICNYVGECVCEETCTGTTTHDYFNKGFVTAKEESCVTSVKNDICKDSSIVVDYICVGNRHDYNSDVDGNCNLYDTCIGGWGKDYFCEAGKCTTAPGNPDIDPSGSQYFCEKCDKFWRTMQILDLGNLPTSLETVWNSITPRSTCCPNTNYCSYGSTCYAQGSSYDINSDGNMDLTCTEGSWTTCEYNSDACNACTINNIWINTESKPKQCCGNDDNEFPGDYQDEDPIYLPDSCPASADECTKFEEHDDCLNTNCEKPVDECNDYVCNTITRDWVLTPKAICTPCGTNEYCNGEGDCEDADSDSDICECATDQTEGQWTWDHVDTELYEGNHEDAGIIWAGEPSIFKPSEVPDPQCCGDDLGEFYKSDYWAPGCVDDIDDCIWLDGNVAQSDTGNTIDWCFEHEWGECKLPSDIGNTHGNACCAGIEDEFAFTETPLSEAVYSILAGQTSCSDGYDNDCDSVNDYFDSDCLATISGYVFEIKNEVETPLNDATVKAVGVYDEFETRTNTDGYYAFNTLRGGSPYEQSFYDIYFSKFLYLSETILKREAKYGEENSNNDIILTTQSILCESDCTYRHDNVCHQECNGKSGCIFGSDEVPPLTAIEKCDGFKQPGFTFEYTVGTEQKEFLCCTGEDPNSTIISSARASSEDKNMVKTEKIVIYNGEPIKMVVVVSK